MEKAAKERAIQEQGQQDISLPTWGTQAARGSGREAGILPSRRMQFRCCLLLHTMKTDTEGTMCDTKSTTYQLTTQPPTCPHLNFCTSFSPYPWGKHPSALSPWLLTPSRHTVMHPNCLWGDPASPPFNIFLPLGQCCCAVTYHSQTLTHGAAFSHSGGRFTSH